MHQLNYQHLFYFWMVAREGSVAAASRALRLTPATLSVQVRQLEAAYGQHLLERVGRNLALTDIGRVVYRYADGIFSIGKELEDYLEGRPTGGPLRLDVGAAPVLPKLVTWRLLEPVFHMVEPCHLVCREESPQELLSDLLLHAVDVVISDAPLRGGSSVRVFNHPLGESRVVMMARADLSARYAEGFPASLDGAPLLLPVTGTALRRSLDSWLGGLGVHPRIVAEFDDSALLEVAGANGLGIIPIPEVVADEAAARYGVERLGLVAGVVEQFYAVSAERRIAHPAVAAIVDGAEGLFGAVAAA